MTYVPGYQWDVFVSFANNDNDAARMEDRWVSRFVEELKIGIRTWLGAADKLKVFFEKDSIPANLKLPTLLDYARNSAIFIAIVSPSYVRRDWPLDELTAFCESGDTSDRLFAIECLPAGDYALFPGILRDIAAMPFFIQDKDSRAPRPLSPDQDPRMWKNRIGELAHDIATRMKKFRPVDGNLGGNGDHPVSLNGIILLAQTTDDLTEQCDDVRRYLTQAGYSVLPRQGIYPQGGEEFKAAFKADLDRANFYVQLLGSAKSRRDPELPEGYARFQFESAKAALRARPQLKTFCWRPIYLDVDEVKHEDGNLLRDETVVAMTLESFKSAIQLSIEKSLFFSGNGGIDAIAAKSLTVYINAAPDDREIAGAVSDECARQGFTAVMQPSENSALDLFREVKKSFGACNAYFLVFGKADTLWAVRQGASFSKISAQYSEAELPKLIAIIDGPPEDKNPPPIRLPRSRVINCRTSLDPMRQVLAELRP